MIVLGLDIGLNTIGWALTSKSNNIQILDNGVRHTQFNPDFHGEFKRGHSVSPTKKKNVHAALRRVKNRKQYRRDYLLKILQDKFSFPSGEINNNYYLNLSKIDIYNLDTFDLFKLRHKATFEKISLLELGRIFTLLNKKRGFRNNAKSFSATSNKFLKTLENLDDILKDQTIGTFLFKKLKEDKFYRIKNITFSRKAHKNEFDTIWKQQQKYYPKLLTGSPATKDGLYNKIANQTIYFQRPLRMDIYTKKKCKYEKNRYSSPISAPIFEYYSILMAIDNLEIFTADGEEHILTKEEKEKLVQTLFNPNLLSKRLSLNKKNILGTLKLPETYFVSKPLMGAKNYCKFYNFFTKNKLDFPPFSTYINQNGWYGIWHILYSIEEDQNKNQSLQNQFHFNQSFSKKLIKHFSFPKKYSSFSNKYLKKMIPYLEMGLDSQICLEKCGYLTEKLQFSENGYLKEIKPNIFHAPMLENLCNQIRIIYNAISKKHGKPEKIIIRLHQTLKLDHKKRRIAFKKYQNELKYREKIKSKLLEELELDTVNSSDILRYQLWQESNKTCLYSGKEIKLEMVFDRNVTEVDHIIPYSISYNDSFSNKILTFKDINNEKSDQYAYTFINNQGGNSWQLFKERIEKNKAKGFLKVGSTKPTKMSDQKINYLFFNPQNDNLNWVNQHTHPNRFFPKTIKKWLNSVCDNVSFTDFSTINYLDKKLNLSEFFATDNLKKYGQQLDEDNPKFQSLIAKRDLRNYGLNAFYTSLCDSELMEELSNNQFSNFNLPPNIISKIRTIFVSHKKDNTKAISPNISNRNKFWTPRGALHEETIFGQKGRLVNKILSESELTEREIELINDPNLKNSLKIKFKTSGRKRLPISKTTTVDGTALEKIQLFIPHYTKRVKLGGAFSKSMIGQIKDPKIKSIIIQSLTGNKMVKPAQSTPISPDGIHHINRLTIEEYGNLIPVRNGFARPGNNHHALIFQTKDGKFNQKIFSLWETIQNINNNIREKGTPYPIIQKTNDQVLGEFMYSMQRNDLFVFDLDPEEINYFDPRNRLILSDNLFRLQKFSLNDYIFRHHLEEDRTRKQEFAFRRVTSLKQFYRLTKIRVNHLGEIVQIIKKGK